MSDARPSVMSTPPSADRPALNASPDFAALTWIGFISNATDKAVFSLDALDLSNKAL